MKHLIATLELNISRLTGGMTSSDFVRLRNIFSFTDKETQTPRYLIAGTPDNIQFYSGLVHDIKAALKTLGYLVTVVDCRRQINLPKDILFSKIIEINKLLSKHGMKLRDYQIDALDKLTTETHCSMELATGSGKTCLAASAIYILDRPTLVLVDSVELMHQAAKELALVLPGEEIGKVGAGIYEPRKYTIGIVDSLLNRPEVLSKLEYIVVDEAHLAASATFRQIIFNCPAYIRHGFTGTYLRSLRDEILLLRAVTGHLAKKVTASDLITKGYLSKPYVTMVKVPGEKLPSVPREEAIRRFIIGNKYRNQLACKYIKHHWLLGHKILVFVTRISHGNKLKQMLVDGFGVEKDQVAYVHFNSGIERRQKALDALSSGKVPIVIATKIFEKGVNVPSVDVGVNLKGEYTEIGTRQTIGRLLRGNTVCHLLDFYDMATSSLNAYSRNRLRIYQSESAFETRVVSPSRILNAFEGEGEPVFEGEIVDSSSFAAYDKRLIS